MSLVLLEAEEAEEAREAEEAGEAGEAGEAEEVGVVEEVEEAGEVMFGKELNLNSGMIKKCSSMGLKKGKGEGDREGKRLYLGVCWE
jgi:hypothetical protein